MSNYTRIATRSARRVGPKPAFALPQSTQSASRKEIFDLLEPVVNNAIRELPDRYRPKLSEQLSTIKKELTQSSVQQAAQHALQVVTTAEQLDQLEAEIRLEKQAVIILATSGSDPSTATLIGISFRVGDKDYYLPLWHQFPGGQLLPDQLTPTLLANRFSLAGVEFITHDAKTVIHFFRDHAGISVQCSHDIMLASKLEATDGQADLNTLEHRLPGKAVSEVPFLSLGSLQHQSIEATARIMSVRCQITLEIFRSQQPCKNPFLLNSVEIPLVPVVVELEDNGYQVDCDYMKELRERCETEKAKLHIQINTKAKKDINPDCFNATNFIYDKLDIPLHERTFDGLPPIGAASLQPIVKKHPVVFDMFEYERLSRVQTDIASILADVDKDDRYRVTYNQLGTKSGRFTSKSRMQNLPKDDRFGLRRGFTTKPGCKLVAADFVCQELRVLATLSGDANLQAAFQGGVDVHGWVAKVLFNLPCDPGEVKEQYPAERQKAKAFQYALINGATAYRIAQILDIEEDRVASLMANYLHEFPGVKTFIDDAHGRLLKDGYLDDIFGRRRWFPDVLTTSDHRSLESAKRSGQNHLVQAASATITKLAMIRCFNHITKEHPEIKMVLTLHDELHFEVPDALVDHFAQELPELMCNLGLEKFGFQVPMKVEVKVGPNWADLKPYAGGGA